MTGDYPNTPAELIVIGSNTVDDSMVSRLDQFLKAEDQTNKSLVCHATAAKQWLEDNAVLPAVAVPQSTRKPEAEKKQVQTESDEGTATPKKKMRTADDVIKRIQWQQELNSEDFTVGYLDRFLGVQEKEFGAFSWDDIATVDDYAVLAIPKHRIQYFKYCGKVIWDKTMRLDNVFGSTGSGVTLSSFVTDSNPSVVQKDLAGQASESVCAPDKGEDCSIDDDSGDKGDNVSVTLANSEVSGSVPCSTVNLKHPVIPPLPQRQQKRRRPNYFVCQRITNPAIIKGVEEIQSKIMKGAPAFSSCFVDPMTLHMTVCSLALDTESKVIYCAEYIHHEKFKEQYKILHTEKNTRGRVLHRVQKKRGHGFFCITLTNVDTVS